MKAIETKYKGYRFRSRLEARWAVFFDALGIVWEYEPQGYELSDGTRYLPDFRIPTVNVGFPWFVEVKGQAPTSDELRKCALVVAQNPRGDGVWLVQGDPMEHRLFYRTFDSPENWAWGASDALRFHGFFANVYFERQFGKSYPANSEEYYARWEAEARSAAEKARGARFEFGESG